MLPSKSIIELTKNPSKLSGMLSQDQKYLIASKSFPYWSSEFITLENGLKFSFDGHEYLYTPYTDKHQKQAHRKCTQMGLSTMAILRTFWNCIYRYTLGVIYFFPTDHDVSDFSKGRVKPLASNNAIIGNYTKDTDEVGLKQVGKSFIYFRGMRTTLKMKSIPADEIVVDEKDEADPSACDMAKKRLSHSQYQNELYLSNPSLPNYGIDKDFQESDQRFWLLKCPHCGAWNNVSETFPDCFENIEGVHILACMKCRKELDKRLGSWVAKYPERSEVHGYHYSQLFSPFIKAESIWQEYQKARETGRLGIFFNLTLGLPYVSTSDKLEFNTVLELCDSNFPADPFLSDEPIYMGVDQGRDLHIVFKRRAGDKVLTWTAFERDFEALDKYIEKCSMCIVDALPETRKARELALRHRGKVFLNFYTQQKGQTKYNEQDYTVQENRTESMDASHKNFVDKINVLPPRSKIVEEYATHCCNTAKKLEEDDESGSKRYVWVKLGDDHYRHADNYATVALNSAVNQSIRWI